MRTVLIFIGVYALSLIAALSIGIQLAEYFNSQEEFIAVMLALMIFSAIAVVAFAIGYRLATNVRALGLVAVALAVVAVIVEELPAPAESFAQRSTNPVMVGSAQNNAIAAELLIPAFVMLLIQWALIRRRWLVVRGLEHRTAWPWLTVILAGVVGLNRLGIEIVGAAVRQSVTDWFAGLWLMVTLGAAALLVVMGAVEYYMRRRRLARRAAA